MTDNPFAKYAEPEEANPFAKYAEAAPAPSRVLENEPGYAYGTFWPGRVKQDAQGNDIPGTQEWAWPEFIRSPVRGLQDIDARLTGRLDPAYANKLTPDELGLTLFGIGRSGAAPRPGRPATPLPPVRPVLRTAEQEAADRLAATATDRQAATAALANPEETLFGVKHTTGEVTNDPGLLQAENWARNQAPDQFAAQAAENNAVRVKALEGIAPAENTLTPGQMVTDQFARIAAAHDAAVEAATRGAKERLGAVGEATAPEDVGARARGAITERYGPEVAASEAADTAARNRLQGAIDEAGGNPGAIEADTARQHYGDTLRAHVQAGKDARTAAENRLWAAARQNGDLVFDSAPTTEAVTRARTMLNPEGGDKLLAAEETLYGIIEGWRGPQEFETIKAMRSNINDAADVAFRAGDRRAGSRLIEVRKGLDQSIETAIDARVAAEQAAVKAGTLAPENTLEAALRRERDGWYANRSSGERPRAAVGDRGAGAGAAEPAGTPSVRGTPGATGAAAEERTASGSPAPVAGEAAPTAPEALGTTAERYAAARAFTRETHQIFDQQPAGQVIARGPYGAPEKLPSSEVPGKFANSSTRQVENARNFEAAVGGREEAIAALQDYLAFDLRDRAFNADTGRFNIPAYQRWMFAHRDVLSIYPELQARLGNIGEAQRLLEAGQAARQALNGRLAEALGESNATVMRQYFKPGPAGADAVDRYLAEAGTAPAARQPLVDHITNEFLSRVVPNGEVNPAALARFRANYAPALSRMPELAAKFADAGAAQEAAIEAMATRAAKIQEFERGAARFWMGTDPVTAVTNALSKRAGNDPAANMRAIMQMAGRDEAARNGVRRATLDWLMDKGQTGKEAGKTGTDFLKIQKMQDLVNDNRAALAEVFTPAEMRTLDQIAASLKVSDRSLSGSKAPIGPGTARDIAAMERFGGRRASLLQHIATWGARAAGTAAGHAVFGEMGALLGFASADAVRAMIAAARASRQDTVKGLLIGALRDPAQARILMARATPENADSLVRALTRRMNIAAAATGRNYLASHPDERKERAQ